MKDVKRTLLAASLVVGTVFLSACGGTEAALDVSGFWNGTWRTDTNSSSGGITITLTQDNDQLNGQGVLTNIPLINTQKGPFTGTITGNRVTGAIDALLADVEFSGDVTPDGNGMNGTYRLSNDVQGILALTRTQ